MRDLGWVAQVSKGKKKRKKKLVQNSPSQKRALLGFPSLGPKKKNQKKKKGGKKFFIHAPVKKFLKK